MPSGPYFIAEGGVNHNGQMDLARQLVDAAAAAGCDAVKFQLFDAARVVARHAARVPYQGAGSQESLLRDLQLGPDDMAALAEHARAAGLDFLCTPFDPQSAAALDAMDLAMFKVSSGDITNLGLLEALGAFGRPVLLSTGTGTLGQCEAAIAAIRRGQQAAGQRKGQWQGYLAAGLALMHCVTSYPAPIEQINLRAMATLARAFGLAVGYSDHTIGSEACIGATAMGAVCLEKHLTLDKSLPGPDHAASADPGELAELLAAVRRTASALGTGRKEPAECERPNLAGVRRRLCAARDLPAGHELALADVVALRSETGIAAERIDLAMGRRLRRDVSERTPIAWGDL